MRLTERQWAAIENLLPRPGRKRRRGRPAADNRACVEGILWVLRSGARWRDLPPQYPSPATCWRRLRRWEELGVWERAWRAMLGTLDQKGLLQWEETFLDATFFPARKMGLAVGKTKRGKGTKAVVLADGEGIPLGVCITSATPNEVTLAEPTLARVRVPRCGRGRPRMRPQRIIADRGYDSDPLRRRLRRRGIDLIVPYRWNKRSKPYEDGRKLRRYRRRWKIERTFA